MLTSGNRRQPLDVDVEQVRKSVGLGLAKLGELRRNVADWAMALAHLHARQAADADRSRGGREAITGQRRDQSLGPCLRLRACGTHVTGIPTLQLGGAPTGKARDGVAAGTLTQEAQRVDREVVIVGRERVMARRGDDPHAGRAAATPRRRCTDRGIALDNRSLGCEGVQVPAHTSRGETQVSTERRSADRTTLRDRREDTLARAPFGRGGVSPRRLDIHYISMT